MEDNQKLVNYIIYFLAILAWLFFSGARGIVFFVLVVLMSIIFVFIYLKNNTKENEKFPNRRGETAASRKVALEAAKLYLAPYDDIWTNLRLANTYCTLYLGRDGRTITAKERKSIYNTECQYRSFRITKSNVHSYEYLWDMFCLNFDVRTSYEELLEMAKRFDTEIYELSQNVVSKDINQYTNSENKVKNFVEVKEKVDINNASEIELTSLPGISIVLAKKIIKKREANGGFNTVDDLFLFLNMKPHMEKQLRDLICVKKMKGSVYLNKYNERSVDI